MSLVACGEANDTEFATTKRTKGNKTPLVTGAGRYDDERGSVTHGWNASVPDLSDKLKRGTLRCNEAIELADVLGYDIVWLKRGSIHPCGRAAALRKDRT